MKCSEIIALIEKDYPIASAEDWDNPGLLVGRADREVNRVAVALDATEEAVAFAVKAGAQMLFTHHPLIFGSVRKINDGDFLGRKLLALIENGIVCYAAHTNYDVCRMADLNEAQVALTDAEVLLVTGESSSGEPQGIGRIGNLREPVRYRELAQRVRDAMGLKGVKCFGLASEGDSIIQRVAVSGGAGKSVVDLAIEKGAEVLVTGDIDHHAGLDALDRGMRIIDAGHYGTEHCFIHDAAERLRQLCPELIVEEVPQEEPFSVV